jgi:excisionase family DNA binding protein
MSQPNSERFDSWKEIAAYLGRDLRTVRRWEKDKGLPVHRVPGGERRAVFAYRADIDAWLKGQANATSVSEEVAAVNPSSTVPADEPSKLNAPDSSELLEPAGPFQRQARIASLLIVLGAAIAIGGFILGRGRPSSQVSADTQVKMVPDSQESQPKIDSVTPILPVAKQKIVIEGSGFGLHVPYSNTDSPYLAVRDNTAHWAAGRILPHNWDEVMVDVESWKDTEIVISGFSGEYGAKGWTLAEGDAMEIAIWNPQNGAGPALYSLTVTSANASR